jgi:tungstate transport system ATP-binding protein
VESLSLASGQIHTIVGPNGSGKTTLMKLLSFLEKPASGTLIFKGKQTGTGQSLPHELRRSVTLVMQDHYLFDGSVSSNIAYGLRIRGTKGPKARRLIERALDTAALPEFGLRRADTLSGGESKRVAIARALVLKPDVLLLDEPTANIDKRNTHLIEDTIQRLKSEGLTVVMTTHDFDQAFKLGDTMVSLVAGKVADVSPENIFPCTLSNNRAAIAPGVVVTVQSGRTGPAHVAIDPSDMILSLSELDSSARNCLSGRVVRISVEDTIVKVYVDVGIEIVAVITEDSLRDLELRPGASVYATFKVTSVRVL